jgi:hypothetical protein
MSSSLIRLADISPESEDWSSPVFSDFASWAERAKRVARWEAENPEMAADWTAAILEDHTRTLRADQAAEEAKLPMHLHLCGVGERTVGVIRGGLEQTPAVQAVTEWVQSRATFLLFLGRAGAGKTVAAADSLRWARTAWDEAGVSRWRYSSALGLFVKAGQLAQAMHRGDSELLQRAARVYWLVIDEIGSEYADQGGRWLGELDALIDARYEGRRRTVITTNLPAETFKERYGERIASRVRGDGRVVDCGADDLRKPRKST